MVVRALSVLMLVAGTAVWGLNAAMAMPASKVSTFRGSYSGYLDTGGATLKYVNFVGTATMLGKSTLTATPKYGERFGPGSGCFLEEGIGRLAAKSGSTLHFAYTVRGCESPPSPIAGSFLIYYGTKSLAGAQGSGKYTVSSNGFITFTGTLLVR